MEGTFLAKCYKTRRMLKENKSRGRGIKIANCEKTFILKQILVVFFNLILFGFILCYGKKF